MSRLIPLVMLACFYCGTALAVALPDLLMLQANPDGVATQTYGSVNPIPNDDIFKIMFHPWAMMWAGQFLHAAKKLKEMESQGLIVSPKEFLRKNPYSIIFSLIGGFVVYGFLYTANQLTTTGAFTAGYMADSMISSFTNRELKKVDKENEGDK